VIEHRSLFLLWLSIEVSFSCDWAKEVSWSCLWALRSLLLCVWETCNLVLDFSETLLGSARGTGLLPVCGRNLYNCFVFFLSLHSYYLSAALRLWTLSDSDPENRFHNVRRRSFWKHNSTPPPPFLCFFLTFNINTTIHNTIIYQSAFTSNTKLLEQLGLMPQHDLFLDKTSKCMWYRHQQRLGRHPMMPTAHHNHLNWI